MPLIPNIEISTSSTSSLNGGAIVIGVINNANGQPEIRSRAHVDTSSLDLKALGVTGAIDSLTRIPSPSSTGPQTLVLAGLGNSLSANSLRTGAGSAIRQLAGTRDVVVAFPTSSPDELRAVLEGATLGAYSFDRYRSAEAAANTPVQNITVVADAIDADLVAGARATADAVALVKDLVNTPANDLYPESFVEHAMASVADLPITHTLWTETELKQEGFGGILGVGQGSARPPRLLRLDYAPKNAVAHVALVGKGITFDTGGLSLKSPTSMIGMKYDMAGAATVLAVVRAAATLSLPVHITSWLPLAENMPSGNATRPGDIITVRGGRTVEVLNTDAEGRLVLADALIAAGEEKPDAIIDVATLTGAAVVALGNRTTGLMGNDELVAAVYAASNRVGEPMWPMPLPEELRAMLNSPVADIANIKQGNTAAGMLLAAVFLRDFTTPQVDDSGATIPWAHLDIAGPGNNDGTAYGYSGLGPTGASVQTLIEFLKSY